MKKIGINQIECSVGGVTISKYGFDGSIKNNLKLKDPIVKEERIYTDEDFEFGAKLRMSD